MPSAMRLATLGFLTAWSVSASPTSVGGLSPRAQSISPTDLFTPNGSLTYPSNPLGPADFVVMDEVDAPMAINPFDYYMFIIDLISKLGLNDWDSRLPDAVNTFTNPHYPGITVAATATSDNSRLPQRYLLWALARLSYRLAFFGGSNAGVYTLRVQGRRVGRVMLIVAPINPSLLGHFTADLGQSMTKQVTQELESTSTNQDDKFATLVGNGEIRWTYEFYSDPLASLDVFMGTIGALVQAAEEPNQNIRMFVGSFPNYKAFHVWQSIDNPSTYTKAMLLQSIMNLAWYARNHTDFRPIMSGVYNSDNHMFAQGGYGDFPDPVASGGKANVTVSLRLAIGA